MPFSVLKNTVSNSGMWKPKIFLSISIYLLGKEKWNCLYLERRFQWRVSVQSWRNTSPRKRRNASGGQCRPTETAAFRQTHPWMTKQMTRWRIRQARTCRSTLVIVTSNGLSGKRQSNVRTKWEKGSQTDQVGKRLSNFSWTVLNLWCFIQQPLCKRPETLTLKPITKHNEDTGIWNAIKPQTAQVFQFQINSAD